MSTHVPGFQSFFRFFASLVLAKLATSSIRVKVSSGCQVSCPGGSRLKGNITIYQIPIWLNNCAVIITLIITIIGGP